MNPFPIFILGLLAQAQDPAPLTLNQAAARAAANRPAVQAARLRVEQARRTRSSLGAYPGPRLELQGTTNRDLRGNDDDIAFAQPFDLFGRRNASRALGDAQVALAEAGLRQALAEIQADVIEQYSEAASATLLVQTAAAQLEISTRLEDLTRRRVDAGDASGVQLRRVRIEVERSRQTVKLRESEREAALRRLAGALGAKGENFVVADFAVVTLAPVDAAGLARQRGDLLAIEANRRAAQASARVSRLGFRPDLEVSARTSPWTYGRDNQTGLRLTVNIPLFDNGRVRNEVRAAETQVRAEEAALEDATRRAAAELEAVNVEIASSNEQIAGIESLLVSSRELVRLSEVGYQQGASTLLEVLEANRSLRDVEQSLVEARLRLARAQAAYLRASGSLLEEGN